MRRLWEVMGPADGPRHRRSKAGNILLHWKELLKLGRRPVDANVTSTELALPIELDRKITTEQMWVTDWLQLGLSGPCARALLHPVQVRVAEGRILL